MDILPDKLPLGLITGVFLIAVAVTLIRLNRWLTSRNTDRTRREFFDFATDGMAFISPKWRCMKVNKSLCDLLGYDARELMSMDFQRIIHPDDFNKDLPHLKKILEGHTQSYHSTQRYLDKNGDLMPLNVYVSAQRDKQGMPRHFISQFKIVQT